MEECIDAFVAQAAELLSDDPLFFLLNSYTTGLSPASMQYIIQLRLRSRFSGRCEGEEIGLRVKQNGLVLPCGSSVRYLFS